MQVKVRCQEVKGETEVIKRKAKRMRKVKINRTEQNRKQKNSLTRQEIQVEV